MPKNTFLCSVDAAAAAGGVKMHVLHKHICIYMYNPYKSIKKFTMMHILNNARQHVLKTFQLKCIDIGEMLESQKNPHPCLPQRRKMGQSAHDFCAQKAILGPPSPPPPPPLTPTKVFKVEYGHQIVVGNTWLGSNMLVEGCYIGRKMAVCCSCARFLCT